MFSARIDDKTNLLRSHYYLLRQAYTSDCAVINVGGSFAYLHKGHRGYGRVHFTHSNFVSLIKVLAFKYFNFKCYNLSKLLDNIQKTNISYEPAVFIGELNSKDTLNYMANDTISGDVNYYQLVTRNTDADFFNIPITERSLSMYVFGTPDYKDDEDDKNYELKDQFEMKIKEFRLQHLCNFINTILKSNVATILINPITFVYRDLIKNIELYKFHRSITIFKHEISPTMYDYATSLSICLYIEHINEKPAIYTQPTDLTNNYKKYNNRLYMLADKKV